MTRFNLAFLLAAVVPFALWAASPTFQEKAPEKVSFAKKVQPLLKAKCMGCHNPQNKQGGLDLSTPEAIRKGGVNGTSFKSGHADESLLLVRVLGTDGKPKMPLGFPALSDEEVAIIRNWIAQGASTQEQTISFKGDILPIFKAHCSGCHGDAGRANLHLLTQNGFEKGGISGHLVTPGDPQKSLLVQRIKGEGGKPQMPMGFAPLTATQIAKIETWIKEGAGFEETGHDTHWAYVKPERPDYPTTEKENWVKNGIDKFILAKLESEGLEPSARASKEALIRRVSLDITGLPPTLAEIDAFVNDQSPRAYEKVVDRLFASSHFGERMARPWLDYARYADTDGYEKDPGRVAWKWRDWVINAYNTNMPFDEFTIEQIGGDMMPNATLDQKIATGFNRNSMLNLEGGVDQAEARFEMIIDRLGTTSTVWLGSTVACARCHDHKYDPISQKDFYKLYAVFSNTDYTPVGPANVSEEKWIEPSIPAPTPEQTKRQAELEAERKALEALVNRRDAKLDEAEKVWLSQLQKAWLPMVPTGASADGGVSLAYDLNGVLLASGANPGKSVYTVTFDAVSGLTGLLLEALPNDALPNRGPGRSSGGNFLLSKLRAFVGSREVKLAQVSASFNQKDYNVSGTLDDNPETGWAVYPEHGKSHDMVVQFAEPLQVPAGEKLELVFEHQSMHASHSLGSFRVSASAMPSPIQFAVGPQLRGAAAKPNQTAEEADQLKSAFRRHSMALAVDRQKLDAVQAQLSQLQRDIPTAMVMKENPAKGPLKAHLHTRGEFLSPAVELEAGVPEFLGGVPISKPVNRLSLGKWLVHRDNPLTARVQVNRYWEMIFGHGIVETSEDLGTQSSPPSHPELLDWLAVEFMDSGWDVKHVLKLMVMSETYRQTSDATPELLEKDPRNFLYARGPRFRMEAEMIRDTAYSAAGILSAKVGGPSVYPLQPDGIWNNPFGGTWMTSKGEDLYRRGLYTYWKRTSAYPSFLTLDATTRESCTIRRVRTNTPLQALALMNDEAMLVAAKALAEKMSATGKSEREKIVTGFRLCTGRRPNDAEIARLSTLLTRLRVRYQTDQEAAKKLSGDADSAAWTVVANVLLNLDETLTKG